MATNFPANLDDLDLTRGTSTDKLSSPSHVTHHTNEDDAIEALQAKVGIDSSADTDSIDYKLTNASSVSPGHKHTSSDITDLVPISSSTGVADAGKLVKLNASGELDKSFSSVTIESFTSDSTWSKPSTGKWAFVQGWGGGGGGGGGRATFQQGGGGGGGAGYGELFLKLSELPTSCSIVIGQGGTGGGTNTNGTNGTATTFYGITLGGGGAGGVNGNEGRTGGAGGSVISTATTDGTVADNGAAAVGQDTAGNAAKKYGGGSGGGGYSGGTAGVAGRAGGNSVYGGAGGGGGGGSEGALGADGVSLFAGTYGKGGTGGKGSNSGSNGNNGRVVITTF